MKKILQIVTTSKSLVFFLGQSHHMKKKGYDYKFICTDEEHFQEYLSALESDGYAVEIPRTLAPFKDIIAVVKIIGLISKIKPMIVHSHTPKAGLLGTFAAWLYGCKIRIYQIRGLPYESQVGWRRALFKLIEFISCRLATHVICESQSLRQIVIKDGIVKESKATVIGRGGNGVDCLKRFNPQLITKEERENLKKNVGIPANNRVIGFVGRLVNDKGILELIEAWKVLLCNNLDISLLLVAPSDSRDMVKNGSVISYISQEPTIIHLDFTYEIERYYSIMDIFAFPSHREGLPNVLLEASSMELAIVSSNATGCVDIIRNRINGTLVDIGDIKSLAYGIQQYLDDELLRNNHSKNARKFVVEEFQKDHINNSVAKFYDGLLI